MSKIPEFNTNMKSITDFIKYMPRKLLGEHNDYSLSWYFTPYDNIAIKVTGGFDTYHHAIIIFKGDGQVKVYFYNNTEQDPDRVLYSHFAKHRDEDNVQTEIINILTKHGGFKV